MVVHLIQTLSGVLYMLIIVDVVASWIPSFNRSEFITQVRRVTEPMLAPFRLIAPPEKIGMDLSPIGALIVLRFIEGLLVKVFG